MAKFIVFEGIDGSGKTTHIPGLAEDLQKKGYKVLCTREPGGTKIGERIREILLDPANTELDERAEALLYAAARAQHVREVIKPALASGQIVLCDRFCASTLAYQGYGRGIGLDFLRQVNSLATGGLLPDLTILFDLSPEEGLRRVYQSRQDADRLERERTEFYRRIRQGYLALVQEEGTDSSCSRSFETVNAEKTMDEVYAYVYSAVEEIL